MSRIRSMTLHTRLLALGGGGILAVVVLAAVSLLQLSSIKTSTHRNASAAQQARLVGKAYESWILNNDQNNTYAGLIALHDPSKAALTQTTWTQAAAAYDQSVAFTGQLKRLVTGDPAVTAQVQSIERTLQAYDGFSLQIHQAGLANDAAKAVYIATVGNLAPSNALRTLFTNLRTALERRQVNSAASVNSSVSSATLIVLLVAALVLPLLLVLVVTTIRSTMHGVMHLMERVDGIASAVSERLRPALEALARGDFTVDLHAKTQAERVTRTDELGQIMVATEHMRDSILECYDAYNRSTQQLRGVIIEVSQAAESVDGTSRQVAESSDQTGRATAEVAHAIEHVANGAERQVQMIETARTAADEVTAAVTESARHAERTAEAAARAHEIAQQGVLAAEQADGAMQAVRKSSQSVSHAIDALATKSEQIGAIVETITGIAEQTNLLALNAAIEAARAGEQGRGFAVVAEEVRKLAEESQRAAHEISDLIVAIQNDTSAAVRVVKDGAERTADGASVVEQARGAFVSIGEAVEDMTARVEQIAASAQEIAAVASTLQQSIGEAATVAEESSASTQEVSASTEETSATTEQVAASAHELAQNAAALEELVTRFQVNP
jgi:methyl-accepting chemotaxis protein